MNKAQAHNIILQRITGGMPQGVGGVNPRAVEGYIGTLPPQHAIQLANQILRDPQNKRPIPALDNAVAQLMGNKDYADAMEKERMGQAGGFGDNRNVPIEQAEAIRDGQIAAANAGALGDIFQGDPNAFVGAFGPQNRWDQLVGTDGRFARQFMEQGFLNSLPNMVQDLNQGIARDMYANRNQRNWSKMMTAQNDLSNRYLDIMEKMYNRRSDTQDALVSGMPGIVGSLGESLKGLNMFNPAGPQGVEDVDGTALVSQAVDPTRVDVQGEIDIETNSPLQAALAGKLQAEAADDLFGDQEQAAGQYAEGLGQRVAGIGSGLAGDAETRQQSAVNMAAKSNRETSAAINQAQNAAQRQQMASNFGTGMFQDMTGMFG
mgnify:FL=1